MSDIEKRLQENETIYARLDEHAKEHLQNNRDRAERLVSDGMSFDVWWESANKGWGPLDVIRLKPKPEKPLPRVGQMFKHINLESGVMYFRFVGIYSGSKEYMKGYWETESGVCVDPKTCEPLPEYGRWIKHDGSDECPVDADTRVIVHSKFGHWAQASESNSDLVKWENVDRYMLVMSGEE